MKNPTTTGRIFLFLITTLFFIGTAGIRATYAEDSLIPEEAQTDYNTAVNIAKQDIDRALLYSKEALRKVNPKQEPLLNAKINQLMGDLYSKKNNLQPAINYYLISAKVFEKLNKKESLCKVYQQLGEVYYRNNYNLNKALEYYNKALELAVELNDESLAAEIYNRLGGVFFSRKNYDQAAAYFEDALKLWKKQNNKSGIAKAYNNIGEIARMKGEFKSALIYYNKSLEINKELNNIDLMAVNFENTGLVTAQKKEYIQALKYFQKAQELYNRTNDQEKKLEVLLEEANIYFALKKYPKAEKIYHSVYETALRQKRMTLTRDAAKGLSNILEKTNNSKEALQYYKIYSDLNDSINSEKQKATLTEMQSRFINSINEKEIAIKDKEIALLKSDKRIHRLELYLTIAGFIVFTIIAFLLVSRYRSLLKKERLISIKNSELHRAQKELMELEIKNKDADLANFALHIVEKNNFLKMINKELKAINKAPEDEKIKKINNLIFTVQQNLQIQKELEEFRSKVDSTYEGFFKRLKEKLPGITKNEERLCALLRLNLSSKEIAALNNTSVKAVEMSRYRLRKKCGLGNNENLCDFLEKI